MADSKNTQTEQLLETTVSRSVIDFTPSNLSHIFKNINHQPCNTIGYDFFWHVTQNGKIIGELFYSSDEREWWFIKDNFPHQRKSYRINFPIKETSFFIEVFKTINVDLQLAV